MTASAQGPSDYAGVLDRLAAFLERGAPFFPAVARARADLEEQLALLRSLREKLNAPLLILLAGGTGAGKSTLLNALAGGAEVARTSAVRPCTTRLTCYYHVQNELAIADALFEAAEKAPHRRPELLDKVVIDAPDFDSTLAENEALLRRALSHADFVVCLATPEKYADADLYALLDEHHEGRAFAFVLNRLDLGIDDAVIADFRRELAKAGFGRAPLLVLSALAALERKRAASEGDGGRASSPVEGDFARLERLIERELTRARIREIKRLNLDELVHRLVSRVQASVPRELERRVERWRAGAVALAGSLRDEIADRLACGVAEDRPFRRLVEVRLGTSYRRLFGLYSALLYAVRALRDRDYPRPWAGEAGAPPLELRARLSDEDRAVVAPSVALASRRIADLGEDLGLGAGARAAPLEPGAASALLDGLYDEVDRRFVEAVRSLNDRERPRLRERVEDLLFNAAPVGLALYAVFRFVYDYVVHGRALDVGYFLGAALVLILLLSVEGAIADRLVRRRTERFLGAARALLAAAADRAVARPLRARLEATIADVTGAAGSLEAVTAEAAAVRASHGLVRDAAEPTERAEPDEPAEAAPPAEPTRKTTEARTEARRRA